MQGQARTTRRLMAQGLPLLALMLLVLSGCGPSAGAAQEVGEPDPTTTAVPTTEAPTTEAPTTAAPTTEAPEAGTALAVLASSS